MLCDFRSGRNFHAFTLADKKFYHIRVSTTTVCNYDVRLMSKSFIEWDKCSLGSISGEHPVRKCT